MLKNFWQKKIVDPLKAQLLQGLDPHSMAWSLALGATVSVLPILGVTTPLGLLLGYFFRLNHVAIQTANYVGYPLQLALLVPFYRAGESLFGVTEPVPLNIPQMLVDFFDDPWTFIKLYGLTALMGAAVWMLVAPFAIFMLKWTLTPFVLKLHQGVTSLIKK